MRTLSPDTDPRAEAVMIELFRHMTPSEKLGRVFSLRAMTIALARVRIRERHGELPEREVRMRLASLWLDRETMRRVYGWDPDVEGIE
jgi:hypothetical protein